MPDREESTIRRLNLDYRVTIPKSIREKLGLFPGTEVEFKINGDEIEMIKKTTASNSKKSRVKAPSPVRSA